MKLQENIDRIKGIMGIINESNNSYNITQIKNGIDKSIKDGDIEIKTNVDNVIDNIDKYNFKVGSVESFLYDDDSFISEALPDKLISYIQDNGLNIDISKLVKFNNIKKDIDKNEREIFSLQYEMSDDMDYSDEINMLYKRNDELYPYLKLLNNEILKIKKQINNL